jgi:hypothetical protein
MKSLVLFIIAVMGTFFTFLFWALTRNLPNLQEVFFLMMAGAR